MSGAPILRTERLILREPGPQDVDGVVRFYMSDRSRFVGGPLGRRQAWLMLASEIGHWRLRGFGMWAATESASDVCIGMVGCWRPDDWPENEIGWLLWEGAEGKGFAHEAALAARRCAYERFGWSTAVSYIVHGNTRSAALAERLGATIDATAEQPSGDRDCWVYRHPAPDALGLSVGGAA